jgi:hypothetical protein
VPAPGEQEEKAGDGCQRRQRIERHSEGSRQLRSLHPQQHHAHLLRQKLKQNASDHQQGDDLRQRKETEAHPHQS